jgi:hypothetical protein
MVPTIRRAESQRQGGPLGLRGVEDTISVMVAKPSLMKGARGARYYAIGRQLSRVHRT